MLNRAGRVADEKHIKIRKVLKRVILKMHKKRELEMFKV